jgi:hypothetical protein
MVSLRRYNQVRLRENGQRQQKTERNSETKSHTMLSNTSMRRFRIWLTAVALVLTVAAPIQAAQFPALECETLTGRHLTMPADAQGNPALFIVGFSKASSEQTGYWAKHIPKDLVPTYPIAVLEGVPRLARRMTVHGIKTGVPKPNQDHFLIIYDNEKELKAAAEFQAPDEAYLILIAPDGSILWRFHGAFTHTALKDLRDHLHGVRQ